MATWFKTKKTKGPNGSYSSTTQRSDGKNSRSQSVKNGNSRTTYSQKSDGKLYQTETYHNVSTGMTLKKKKLKHKPPKIAKEDSFFNKKKPKTLKHKQAKMTAKQSKMALWFSFILVLFYFFFIEIAKI